MTSEMIASLIGVGVVGMLAIGVLLLMRPKRITLVDYPELPPPPKDDAGPTRQA